MTRLRRWWKRRRERARVGRVYRDALAEVNRVRALAGLGALPEFPQGVLSATGCPVAQALYFGAQVLGGRTLVSSDTPLAAALARAGWKPEPLQNLRLVSMGRDTRFVNPPVITDFVRAFDHGKFPQLLMLEGTWTFATGAP